MLKKNDKGRYPEILNYKKNIVISIYKVMVMIK